MKYQITWRSGSTEIVEGDTWQKALHAKKIPSYQWRLIKRIRREGPPPTMAKPIESALSEIDTMLANAGAIK